MFINRFINKQWKQKRGSITVSKQSTKNDPVAIKQKSLTKGLFFVSRETS